MLTTSCLQAISPAELLLEEWQTWKTEHGKTYGRLLYGSVGRDNKVTGGFGGEENFRMKIWMENKAKIERHNRAALKGLKSYTLAMNQFGDLLHHEFTSAVNGYRKSADTNKTGTATSPRGATFLPPAHVDSLPSRVDWREAGAVTPVKNQGLCGSCYSFSATGALEAMYHRKTGVLTSLSEQNIIDCSRQFGNQGCGGGLPDLVYRYIKENNGIDTETSYPYEDINPQPNSRGHACRYNPVFKGAMDVGFVDVEAGNEAELKIAVATMGPCSVGMDASHESFQLYSRGIYREEQCSTMNLDHAVLAIGYGVEEESGEEYWLVKNSWGTSWGEEGYFQIARNKDNMCGIATDANFPLV
jgi:cathepsin L